MGSPAETVKNEPVALAGAIVAVVTAGITLVTVFGLKVTPDQAAAIVGITTAILTLVGAIVARHHVTPVRKIEPAHAADPDESDDDPFA